MKKLEGRWVLVTGSSRGVGRQIAVGLAQHGCNVIVHGRELANTALTVSEVEAQGVEAIAVAGDLGTAAGIEAVVKAVAANPGYVDILYNNAAVMSKWQDFWEIEPAVWQRTFQVNLWAPIELCKALAPEMKRRGWGRIVNLTSGIKDTPQLAPYSVSKAAIDKYTRDLAAELKGTGVLANYLDPGWLKTDMGGPDAMYEPEDVLPGALEPALLEDDGPTGKFFYAHEHRQK